MDIRRVDNRRGDVNNGRHPYPQIRVFGCTLLELTMLHMVTI